MAIKNNYPTIRPALDLNFAGSKTVDPRVTFTRTSTATYYDGKTVAKAEENLLIRSQEFDTVAWTKVSATVSANTAIAPDGTNTADTLTAQAGENTQSSFAQSLPLYGDLRTHSIFAKAGTHNFIQLTNGGDFQGFVTFDLSDGTIGSSGAGISGASIVGVGNGWYRCSYSRTYANNSNFAVVLVGSKTASRYQAWSPTGTESVHIWGAQLEQRDTVTAYTPTADQPITRYQPVLLTAPANTPRIDHDPVTGECKGLLIEESRTNLVLNSGSLMSVYAGAMVEKNAIAPDGSVSGVTVVDAKTDVSGGVIGATTVSASQNYVFSVFIKQGTSNKSAIWLRDNTNATYVTMSDFAWSSGVPSSSGWECVNFGNGWYRVSKSFTTAANMLALGFYLIAAGNAPGDTGSTIFWGAQLETGAFPTSYIKTEASQVTRAADNASMTGTNFSSWYRPDEGTAVVEANWDSGSLLGNSNRAAAVFGASVDSAGNRILFYNANGFPSAAIVTVAGSTQAFAGGSGSSSADFVKAAAGYKTNDFAYARKGGDLTTDAQITLPNLDVLYFGKTSANVGYLNGHIKRLTYYPKRLSNAQLQALTL